MADLLTQTTRRSPRNRWGMRFIIVFYLTALMTLTAPISALNSPRLTPAIAEPDTKSRGWVIAHYEYGYNKTQFGCLLKLWGKESAWNHLADNPQSTAFGIAQMLGETSTDPAVQIRNGLRYISSRYTNACNAWAYWQRNYWY